MSENSPGATTLGLLQQSTAKKVDPEQLEAFGKKAAALYCEGTNLNEAVTGVIKTAALAPEQVKRVCEFANTAAYLNAFEKSGEARNVEFDGGPANPAVVIQNINDGSAPQAQQIDTDDYVPPVGQYKTASVRSNDMLSSAFQCAADGMEKTASARYTDHTAHANPVEELWATRTRLEGARDHFMSKVSSSNVHLEQVQADMIKVAELAHLEGVSLKDMARAWSAYGDTPMVKRAMMLVCDRLRDRGKSDEQITISMAKTAGGSVPNPTHPIIERFVAFTKIAAGDDVLQASVRILDEQLAQVNPAIKRSLNG
jgi:hypothetical protein